MKSPLLNSIYLKLSQTDDLSGLKKAVSTYIKYMYILYLDVLEDCGVNDLDEKIEVKTKFQDGYTLKHTYEAGYYLINLLLDSDEYKKAIQNLDSRFLDECECPNKEQVLNYLKAIIAEVGSETIKKEEWDEISNYFENCPELQGEDE